MTITVNGDDNDNTLVATSQSDELFGGAGADMFVLNSLVNVDTIKDFNQIEGDVIDVSDILDGYDPITDSITDFVEITDNGADSIVAIDVDGGADNFVQVAVVEGVTGLTDEEALDTSGALITV